MIVSIQTGSSPAKSIIILSYIAHASKVTSRYTSIVTIPIITTSIRDYYNQKLAYGFAEFHIESYDKLILNRTIQKNFPNVIFIAEL